MPRKNIISLTEYKGSLYEWYFKYFVPKFNIRVVWSKPLTATEFNKIFSG
jgi:hypothetical protein